MNNRLVATPYLDPPSVITSEDSQNGFPQLYQPQWWDLVTHSNNKQEIYNSILSLDPGRGGSHEDIILYRQAAVLFNLFEYKAALERLEGISRLPHEGLKRLCIARLSLHKELTSFPFEPSDYDPIGLEDTYYGEYAMATAYAELGDYVEGIRRLQRIRTLLPLIGFQRQQQSIDAEIEKQMMEADDLSDLLELSMHKVRNPQIRSWINQSLVLSFLSQGRMTEALDKAQMLANSELGDMVKAFLMKGEFSQAKTPEGMLANCIHRAIAQTNDIPDEPLTAYDEVSRQVVAYVSVCQAVQAYHTENYVLAKNILLEVRAKQPLLRFLEQMLQFAILSKIGGAGVDMILLEIKLALARLSEEKEAIALAAGMLPEAFVLLCLSETIDQRYQALVPVLYGPKISYQNQTIKVHKEYGPALLRDALNRDTLELSSFDPAIENIYQKHLEASNIPQVQLVNVAFLWHAAERLKLQSLSDGDDDLAHLWQDVQHQLTGQSSHLAVALKAYTNPYV